MPKIVHPNPVVLVAQSVLFAILLSAVLYLVRDYVAGFFGQALAFFWGLALIVCALAFVSARFITLEIREKDLLFRRGVLNVRTVLVPYSKVTDTRYTQSLLERVMGVGTLEVETASESGVAIRMPAVRYEDVKGIMGDVSGKSEGK